MFAESLKPKGAATVDRYRQQIWSFAPVQPRAAARLLVFVSALGRWEVDDHHDVAVIDESGKLLGKRRIADDADGLDAVLELLACHLSR